MRHIKIIPKLLVLLALAIAFMGSSCTVTLSQDFDLFFSLSDQEIIAYTTLKTDLTQYDAKTPFSQNMFWDSTDTDFVDWQHALDDLSNQLALLKKDWQSATDADRSANQSDYNEARNRMDQLMSRAVSLNIVVEPWTVALMTRIKQKWQTSLSTLTSDSNALFSAAYSVPVWNVVFTNDSNPTSNSSIGMRDWSIDQGFPCSGGDDPLVPCSLANDALVGLKNMATGSVRYLHQQDVSTGINLGWTDDQALVVRFLRQPGKTGALTYNEPLALYVVDVGYVYYKDNSISVALDNSTTTPRYEWSIVAQWAEMSGQAIDIRQPFALVSMTKPGYLTWCRHPLGADLGWYVDPTNYSNDANNCH